MYLIVSLYVIKVVFTLASILVEEEMFAVHRWQGNLVCRAVKSSEESRYCISSNKRLGAHSKFRLKAGALIGRRALNRVGACIKKL